MDTDPTALRKRCDAKLRDLEIPVPFDIRVFCDRIARQRKRRIVLRPVCSGTGPFGVWAPGDVADYIFYETDTSPLHQEHIILHELSHLLCGHQPTPIAEAEFLRLLLPDVSPDLVRNVLQRATYSAAEEREAELLASLIVAQAIASGTRDTRSAYGQSQLLQRLSAALEDQPEGLR